MTSSETLVKFNRYAVDTTSGSFSVTLPASPSSGDWLILTDAGNWGVNNLTVLRNSSTIEGVADDLLISVGNINVEFAYVNSTWQVVTTLGQKGDDGFTGSAGPPGGYTGSQGIQGFTGSNGFTGSQGAGFTGSQGTTGFTGSVGPSGGYTGSQGIQGFTGSNGFTGSQGAGFTGSQGTTGFTGSAGTSGAVTTFTNGADNRVVTATGSEGITGETNLTYDGTTLNLTDGTLQRPVIRDYGETSSTPTISSNALTLDLETGNVFRVTLNANVTSLTISNPPASGTAGSFTLILDITGAFTITWPAAIKWANGTSPTLTTTNGKRDIITFMTTNAGTEWFGFAAGLNF